MLLCGRCFPALIASRFLMVRQSFCEMWSGAAPKTMAEFVCAHATTAAIAHKGSGDFGDDGGIKMADVRLLVCECG